jgi:S-disulfanyl-L-cysteine oxidoreductase SoxD
LVGAAVSFALTMLARVDDTGSLGIGHVPSSAQIASWDVDIRAMRADGQGLPPGLGSVREGEKISRRPARPAITPRVKVNLGIG